MSDVQSSAGHYPRGKKLVQILTAATTRPVMVLALLLSTTYCGSSASVDAKRSDPVEPAGPSFGPASRLVFAEQPSNAIAGSPQFVSVRVEDAIGRLVTSPTVVRVGLRPTPPVPLFSAP
jgi:hypothetical protein